MKTKSATFLFILAMAAPAMAAQSWTLVVGGKSFCGRVNFDGARKPVEFVTERGMRISFDDYPGLNSKSTLFPHCSRMVLNSPSSGDVLVRPAGQKKDPEQAKRAAEQAKKAAEQAKKDAEEQKRMEKKEIDDALDQYCDDHGDDRGCQE